MFFGRMKDGKLDRFARDIRLVDYLEDHMTTLRSEYSSSFGKGDAWEMTTWRNSAWTRGALFRGHFQPLVIYLKRAEATFLSNVKILFGPLVYVIEVELLWIKSMLKL